jgi:hypothetical protein
MTRISRRVRLRDDSGASLVIALLFVTVVALVMGAVLSVADSNFRATVAMRSQAAQAAAADGAAQLAIDALRHGSYNGLSGACFGAGPGASNTLNLSGFTGASSTTTATVVCERDANKSAIDSFAINSPDFALLTLGANTNGIDLDINGSGGDKVYLIGGKVHSNSNINLFKGVLRAGATEAVSGCTAYPQVQPACATAGTVADPNYDPPDITKWPTTKAPDPAPTSCSNGANADKLVTFSPGRYSDVAVLNNRTNGGNCTIFWFKPGVYYFNYPGTWTIGKGTVFAGAPTAPNPNPPNTKTPPTVGNSCVTPFPPDPTPANWKADQGVQFVFGGSAKLDIVDGVGVEICGRTATTNDTGPPIALYGLKTALGSGADKIDPLASCDPPDASCAVLHTNKNSDLPVYIQGVTYLPTGFVNLEFKKEAKTIFNHGVVANYFMAVGPGNSDPTIPAINVQTHVAAAARTVLYLTVRVCPNGGACSAGAVRLRAKVAIGDPSGKTKPGQREITVLNWSVQR